MNYYFIDYENVHSDGFVGVEDNLGKNDKICLLYTDTCKQIPFEVLEKMIHKQDLKLEVIKAGSGGKNALDFQLSSYMGYIIAKNEEQKCSFYIVSKDTGFNHLIDFWKSRGVNVSRVANFSFEGEAAQKTVKAKSTKSKSKAVTNKATKEELLKYISNEEYSDSILEIINSYKTIVSIKNGFDKEFRDTQKSSALYKKLKSYLKAKGKT